MSKFKINPIRSYLTPISNPDDVTVFNSSDVNSGIETITTGSLNTTLRNYLPINGGTITGDLGISQGS
jgi:hypothetical protein